MNGKYPKMCADLQPLQNMWKPTSGDKYTYSSTILDECATVGTIQETTEDILNYQKPSFTSPKLEEYSRLFRDRFQNERESLIWLPRQDQLQEMLLHCNNICFWSLHRDPEGWLFFGKDMGEDVVYPRTKRIIIESDHTENAEEALLRGIAWDHWELKWFDNEWHIEGEAGYDKS